MQSAPALFNIWTRRPENRSVKAGSTGTKKTACPSLAMLFSFIHYAFTNALIFSTRRSESIPCTIAASSRDSP